MDYGHLRRWALVSAIVNWKCYLSTKKPPISFRLIREIHTAGQKVIGLKCIFNDCCQHGALNSGHEIVNGYKQYGVGAPCFTPDIHWANVRNPLETLYHSFSAPKIIITDAVDHHHHVKIGLPIALCEVKRSERGDGNRVHYHQRCLLGFWGTMVIGYITTVATPGAVCWTP